MKKHNITLSDAIIALDEIREHKDLKKFQSSDDFQTFQDKYGLSGGQLNFLTAVIAVERCKKNEL